MNWAYKIKTWQFLILAIALSEGLVGLMSLLLRGAIAPDDLIIGFLVSFVVAFVMLRFVTFANRLHFEKEVLEGEIAERVKAQRDLERVFELSGDLICIASMTHFLRINPAGERMLGYKLEELRKIPFLELIHPDDVEPTGKVLEEKLKKGESAIGFVNRYRHKNGSYRWLEWMTSPVVEENMLYAVARDITERRATEQKLLLQAQMIDMLKDSIISTDLDGFVKTWNRGAERLFGYASFDAIGKHISFVYPPEEHANLQDTITQLKEKGQYETEVKMQRSSGKPFYAILSLSIIYDDRGVATGMIGYSIDVSERKRMEENLRHALADKDVLMREIYHRTKNNMALIQSLLNLQSGQVKDREALNSLNESAYRVRTMSMIHESLYSTGDLTRINIRDYLQSLTTELFNSFGATPRAKIDINILDIPMDVDQVIPLGLIVNELLTNAFKYAFPDDSKGEILVELKDHDDEKFELTVADTGVGLPGDFDITRARTLGLQLVSSLSAQLRGRLSVSGDKGAEFRVIFKKRSDEI